MALSEILSAFLDQVDESEGTALRKLVIRLTTDCTAVIADYSAGEVPALFQRACVALIWLSAEAKDPESRAKRRGRTRAVLDLTDLAEAIHRFHSGHGSDDQLALMRAEITAALRPIVDAGDA
jgi:hypothetical protein